jgi:hypothetical protein
MLRKILLNNVRDPSRDDNHGRILRITYKGRPLMKKVQIHDQPIHILLDLLTKKTNITRYRARIELSKHETNDVMVALNTWIQKWDPEKEEHAHHLLEALWLHQQHNVKNDQLLKILLNSPSVDARNAARTVKHLWNIHDSNRSGMNYQTRRVDDILKKMNGI